MRHAIPSKSAATFSAHGTVSFICEAGSAQVSCVRDLTASLAACQWVEWVDLQQPSAPLMRFATPLSWQTLAETMKNSTSPFTGRLRGGGQVIGFADTGLDVGSCFFFDSTEAVVPGVLNPLHRKVILYEPLVDALDEVAGHGTHVGSTIAGNCSPWSPGGLDAWNGAAPDAKLAFVDIGNSTTVSLQLPADLRDIYTHTYAASARVHCDSWGGQPEGQSTFATFQIDMFQHTHRDFLIVRAAGNTGDHTYVYLRWHLSMLITF